MPGDLPWWLIFVLGVIVGCLGTLAIGPTSVAFWEAVAIVRRWCVITGAAVLGGGTLFGLYYVVTHWPSS